MIVNSAKFTVLIVNMLQNQERKVFIQQQLDTLQLPYHFIEAVNGAEIPPAQLQAYTQNSLFFKPLTKGEVGCYLSHIKVANYIVDNNLAYAVVIEDDVNISPKLLELVNSDTLLQLDNWKVLKLTQSMGRTITHQAPITTDFTLVRYNKPPKSTLGYLLSYDGAKALVSQFNNSVALPIDVYFQHFWLGDFDSLGITPALISTDEPFESQIGQARKLRRSSLAVLFNKLIYKVQYLRLYLKAYKQLPPLNFYFKRQPTRTEK